MDFYSLFPVKVTGGWRPVVSLSYLNRFVQQIKFKREKLTLWCLSADPYTSGLEEVPLLYSEWSGV